MKIRKYAVKEKNRGIYTVTGDILPIQIIDNRRLSAEENLWLRELNFLDLLEMRRILTEIHRQGKASRVNAYLDVITRANKKILSEVLKMSDGTLTLDQIFEEAGLVARWEARGRIEGRTEALLETARKMKDMGLSAEQIKKATGIGEQESSGEW